MASPPRRVLLFLLLASCLGNDSCCGPTDVDECQSDAECTAPTHCNVGCAASSCVQGCVGDDECDTANGMFCVIDTLATVGSCTPGCKSDRDCGSAQRCSIALLGPLGSCVDPPGGKAGTGGKTGTGGKGGKAGASGKTGAGGDESEGGTGGENAPGGSAGQAGTVVVEVDGCALLDDGSCFDATGTGLRCCPLLGYHYDPTNDCLIDGEAYASTIWCVPRTASAQASCALTPQATCYDRLLDDGSHEIAIVGADPSKMDAPSLVPCSPPLLDDPPACASAADAGGAAGAIGVGGAGEQGGSGGNGGQSDGGQSDGGAAGG